MIMMTMQQQHLRNTIMKKTTSMETSTMKLSQLAFSKSTMMIVMILLLSSYSFLTMTNAQIVGNSSSMNTSGTVLVQMLARNYKPYALIFLQASSNVSNVNSTHINITDAVMDTNDLCYNEFEMISNMLYTTYTSALLVESTLTTDILQSLDTGLLESDVFTSVAAVVDGISDQNIIIVHQENLPLPPPDVVMTLPTSSPSKSPSSKPSSSQRPSIDIVLQSLPSSLPSKYPSRMPSNSPTTSERIIDDGIIVTTTDDEDTFLLVGDECASLMIEVVVPTSAPITAAPVLQPVPAPVPVTISTPAPVPVPAQPVPAPVTTTDPIPAPVPVPLPVPAPVPVTVSLPVPAPLHVPVPVPQPVPVPVPVTTSGPNTFVGTFTLVRADMDSSSSNAAVFLGNYSSGATINISSFVNQRLSLVVNFRCCFTTVALDYISSTPGANFINTEGGAPYALDGNSGNNYDAVTDLTRNGPKRIIVFGYNGSNRIIATLVLNFNIVGGRTSRRALHSSPVSPTPATPSAVIPAPVPSAVTIYSQNQCTRRRLLEEEEEEELVFKHDVDDVHNLKYEDLADVEDYDNESLAVLQTMPSEQRRLQVICRLSICNYPRFVIDIYGCRRFCQIRGEYRRERRSLLRREQSQQQHNEIQENHYVERKEQSTTSTQQVIYRKGKRDAITRGRGDVTAAIFYKYVKEYIPNNHVCQPVLLSMTYIVINLDIQ